MRRPGGLERHVLVDGNNLIHRAYYAYVNSRYERGEPLLSGPGGYPTGVIYGSLFMLSSWLYSIPDITKISIFFDGYSKRRKTLDPEYKSNRDLNSDRGLKLTSSSSAVCLNKVLLDGYSSSSEVDTLSHIFSLLGCDVYHDPNEEADDLIASFCRSNRDSVRVIVSADKDFFQLLVDPRVACYVPGIDGDRFFDAEKSAKHWARMNKGSHPAVLPSHVRMFKALCGDSSDGIHGVERLRKKVAVSLCHHQSIDDLYASGLPGMSPSERDKAVLMRDRIRLNYDLVGLDESIDLSSRIREPGRPSFSLATNILHQDLGIMSVDILPFKIGVSIPLQSPEPIPRESWLSDIID